MPNRYLYVPFTEAENNYNLQLAGLAWRKAMHETDKIPLLIVHGEHTFGNQLDSGSIIYVLGHGHANFQHIGTICNTDDEDDDEINMMTMQVLTSRLHADGLTSAINAKIKLFFCDVIGYARQMALNFILELGANYSKSYTTIDYYNVRITTPAAKEGQIYKKATEMVFSPYEGEPNYSVDIGRAHQFRARLSTNTQMMPYTSTLTSTFFMKPKPPIQFLELRSSYQSITSSTVISNR